MDIETKYTDPVVVIKMDQDEARHLFDWIQVATDQKGGWDMPAAVDEFLLGLHRELEREGPA